MGSVEAILEDAAHARKRVGVIFPDFRFPRLPLTPPIV